MSDEIEGTTVAHNITAKITKKAWFAIVETAKALSPNEGSGFLLSHWESPTEYYIDRFFLIKGEATPAYTEMNEAAKRKFNHTLFRHGVRRPGSKYQLHYMHFHTDFGVFQSGTDIQMHQEIAEGADIYPTMVVNKKGEYILPTIINANGIRITLDSIPLSIDEKSAKPIRKNFSDEVKRKITTRVYVIPEGLEHYWGAHEATWDVGSYTGHNEASYLDGINAKVARGEKLRWWEQEALDEERIKAIGVSVDNSDWQGDFFNQKHDSVAAASGFFNYAGTVFNKKKRGK